MPKSQHHLLIQRRHPEELTDSQIERLMSIGKREADLLNELEMAVQANDRDLAWRIAEALVRLENQAAKRTES